MASTTDAKTILDKSSAILNDLGTVRRWPTATELLGWLNDGQLEIATLIPNSNTLTTAIVLIAGVKQSAPSDSIRIIEFVKNMGVGGSTPGNAIRAINRKTLERYLPNWASDTASGVVVHSMYDAEDNNAVFYVWPPQPATPQYIEIIYSKIPVIIANATAGTKITIADYYANALLDYVLYRSFIKDGDTASQSERATTHYKAFADSIGFKFTEDKNPTNDGK